MGAVWYNMKCIESFQQNSENGVNVHNEQSVRLISIKKWTQNKERKQAGMLKM